MSEDEFDAIGDTFRDPRVWAKDVQRQLGQGLDPRVRRAARRARCVSR